MNPTLLKFFKHAGFVIAGAVIAQIAALINGDPTFLAFIAAHPYLSGLVPFVAGLLGSLSKWLADREII